MNKVIKVGDIVMHRGCFGADAPVRARVLEIELCKHEREKYGTPVNEVSLANLRRAVFTLDNDCWAYGFQISPIA